VLAISSFPLFTFGEVLRRLGEILKIDGEELARGGVRVFGIWVLAWFAYRVVRLTARRIELAVDDGDDAVTTLRERRGQTIAQLLRSVGRVVVVVIALLLTFNVFIDIGPILAGAGILGLAVSFGAQSLVKDVISGFFILFENQFAIGDVIEIAGKSGVVEKMTLRVAVLRDGEGVMHVVPNSEIKVVSNKTRGWSTRTSTARSASSGTRRRSSPPTGCGTCSSTARPRWSAWNRWATARWSSGP